MGQLSTTGNSGFLSPDPQDWESIKRWRKVKRESLVRKRIDIGAEHRRRLQVKIESLLSGKLASLNTGTIGFYWPIKGEFDLRALVGDFLDQGWQAALPVVEKAASPLEFRLWTADTKLIRGVWNIPVPAGTDSVFPSVLLAPLVGFDVNNYRLGYGGGYYDRTIASFDIRPYTIGVGLELCRLDSIYPQSHDVPMDKIVTG